MWWDGGNWNGSICVKWNEASCWLDYPKLDLYGIYLFAHLLVYPSLKHLPGFITAAFENNRECFFLPLP